LQQKTKSIAVENLTSVLELFTADVSGQQARPPGEIAIAIRPEIQGKRFANQYRKEQAVQ
jgi:hypothetical protein